MVGGNDVVRALWGGECGACGALEENMIKIGKKIEITTNDGKRSKKRRIRARVAHEPHQNCA